MSQYLIEQVEARLGCPITGTDFGLELLEFLKSHSPIGELNIPFAEAGAGRPLFEGYVQPTKIDFLQVKFFKHPAQEGENGMTVYELLNHLVHNCTLTGKTTPAEVENLSIQVGPNDLLQTMYGYSLYRFLYCNFHRGLRLCENRPFAKRFNRSNWYFFGDTRIVGQRILVPRCSMSEEDEPSCTLEPIGNIPPFHIRDSLIQV